MTTGGGRITRAHFLALFLLVLQTRAAFDTGLYLGVVYPAEETGIQRTTNKTLASLQLPFPLSPLFTPYGSTTPFPVWAENLCRKWEGRTVVGAIVLAEKGNLVLGPALAGGSAAVPMLWLSQSSKYTQEPVGRHVVRLSPSERELVLALRSFLISSKWHAFTLIYAGSMSGLDDQKVKWLKDPPLSPTIHRMPQSTVNVRILRQLAHSSRGVVVVMGDLLAAAAILKKATELGLTSSGLIWIWADTGEAEQEMVRSGGPPGSLRARRSNLPSTTMPPNPTSVPRPSYKPIKLPVGLLALRAVLQPVDRHTVRSGLRLTVEAMRRAAVRISARLNVPAVTRSMWKSATSCWNDRPLKMANFTAELLQELKKGARVSLSGRTPPPVLAGNDTSSLRSLAARFKILNLVPETTESYTQDEQRSLPQDSLQFSSNWKQVGEIIGCCDVRLERIVWPGGTIRGPCAGGRAKVKVVTAVAAPFVMTSDIAREAGGADSCLRGLPCQMVSDFNGTRYTYKVSCCYGLSMDLLEAVSQELDLDFTLFMVPDSMFGSRIVDPDSGKVRWNGVVGDLISGQADMAFAALSVSRPRSQVIDFSTPYYFSGVSFLAAPSRQTDIPLLAFLLPFSPELWVAIFISLNVTAVAVAIYEWLSPFGLNPWGRQRTKNFSLSSALWVCWGLLCGHLVAFKAPKSWPNKFLINVWGGFSVIFVASYTANIAALIAGLFFHSATATYHDNSLLWQRVGAPKGSASDYYVHRANQMLWEHMQRFSVPDVETGVQYLKNGTLDILIADTPILDYYRATDQGCKLQKIGDAINEDTYAVGMTKGFPLKDSVSAVISKLSSNGYMDILQEKWYGGLICFTNDMDMTQPKPLGVTAVAGVFMLLGLGVVMGLLILLVEHLFYRYTLPILRHKPKETIWRSRNVMFFSQKLYRFINCVELVSPHHAARELVHTIRQGQITSLFQKSVKRDFFQKEHEQRRRRKSKAQFFEMIQEIRRVQQEEKQNSMSFSEAEQSSTDSPRKSRSPQRFGTSDRTKKIPSRLELARRFSKDVFRSKSSGNLDSRRLSSEITFPTTPRFFEAHSSQAIGRRLSRDTNLSPPDINSRRASHLQLTTQLSTTSSEGLELQQRNAKSHFLTLPHQRSTVSLTNQNSLLTSPNVNILGKQLSLQEHHPQQHHPPSSKLPKQSCSLPSEPPPEIAVHPPVTPQRLTSLQHHQSTPLHHPSLAKRFSYVDTSSPTFRDRISRFAEDKSKSSDDNIGEGTTTPQKRRFVSTVPSLLDQIASMQEQFPGKPKVVSVVPKQSHPTGKPPVPRKPLPPVPPHRNESSTPPPLPPTRKPLPPIPSQSSSSSTSGLSTAQQDNLRLLEGLSRQELLHLSHIPESELKKRVMKVLRDRNS